MYIKVDDKLQNPMAKYEQFWKLSSIFPKVKMS